MKNLLLITSILFSTLVVSAQKSLQYRTPEEKLNNEYASGMFKTTDGIIFDMSANTMASTYVNILDWLQGRVAGLQIYTSRTGVRIPVIRGNQTSIYVDEVRVTPGYLSTIPSSEIAMIKVIKTPFFGGFNGAGGAIAIYTYSTGDDEEGGK
jgi:hypothetical protein